MRNKPSFESTAYQKNKMTHFLDTSMIPINNKEKNLSRYYVVRELAWLIILKCRNEEITGMKE